MARVLHIEDDRSSRVLVRKILEAAQHVVIDAATGLEGIRLAESQAPELVLVDINIPDLDGYEVTLRLRGMPALQEVPIVAITAEGDRETSLAVGADGFISKPIDAAAFPSLIASFLAGHREHSRDQRGSRLRKSTQKLAERLERKVIELSEANQRLEEMARLRREFMQNISHEFATPLTPAIGYLSILQESTSLDDLQRKAITGIERSIQQLRRLIETLLDVSALESGVMLMYERDYDFRDTTLRALDEIRAKCEDAKIELSVSVPHAPLPARGDPDKLRRAMAHILDNGVKFTPRGGELAVGVETGAERDGDMFFRVADSGPGISKRDLNKIFQPFWQADGSPTRRYGGVGLGLAFASRVAEKLGGQISVYSPPHQPVAGRQLGGTLVVLRVRRMPPPSGGGSHGV